ncbi:TetR/AcrR family transcriptional regulator, partial [Leucobacter sp. M11]|uniref:TetR/AcrR family transcriptional regulator n=1 Tax=Leucobacter sp. M11 TaxID=2993565 RepID=UPI002D7EE08C
MSRLDPERIVDEAMRIMVTEGEAALAMRPLAARLGVTPMALYRYFADRDALLLALVERVSAEIEFPEPGADPVETAVELAACLHDVLARHPWMNRLIATGRLASPAGLRFPEGFLRCAEQAGLDPERGFVFYRTMFATVLGVATITQA